MRGMSRLAYGLACLAVVLVGEARGADEISDETLRNWNYYTGMAYLALHRGNLEVAELRFNTAIKAIKAESKRDQRFLARSYTDLALVLYYQHRYAEADPLATWAMSVREKHAEQSPTYLFRSYYTLGLIRAAERHYPDAEILFQRALTIQSTALGESHPFLVETYDNLADVYCEQRKFAKAEPLYKNAISILEQINPDESVGLAVISRHFATMLRRVDRDEEAQALEDRAKTIRENIARRAAQNAAISRTARTQSGFQIPKP